MRPSVHGALCAPSALGGLSVHNAINTYLPIWAYNTWGSKAMVCLSVWGALSASSTRGALNAIT